MCDNFLLRWLYRLKGIWSSARLWLNCVVVLSRPWPGWHRHLLRKSWPVGRSDILSLELRQTHLWLAGCATPLLQPEKEWLNSSRWLFHAIACNQSRVHLMVSGSCPKDLLLIVPLPYAVLFFEFFSFILGSQDHALFTCHSWLPLNLFHSLSSPDHLLLSSLLSINRNIQMPSPSIRLFWLL